jgi:hypothetical protein
MALKLARTNAEAHVYMELYGCPACGCRRFEPTSSVIMVEGELASRYRGRCPDCGREREYMFWIPEKILLPPPDRARFGGDRPSELMDPGEWMWLADDFSARVPIDPAELVAAERQRNRYELTMAVAALDEVLKFVPPGTDEVPADAFWTDRGREVYRKRPGRFLRGAVLAVKDAYQEIVDAYSRALA